jgi:hypothetical protein
MHSYADRYTHDFFFERDYPDVRVLDAMFARLGPEPVEKTVLQKKTRIDPDLFDKVLEKLWIHGGAVVDYAENVSAGQSQWREAYIAHGEQKRAQIEKMIRFADANQCRMSTLVRHFGDLADGQTSCGICDFCAPAECVAQRFRTATEAERGALLRVLAALRAGEQKSTGRLHTELFPGGEMSRDAFEEVLGAMARAGLARLSDAVFEKDGKQVPYRTVRLTPAGRATDTTTPVGFIMKDTATLADRRKARKDTPCGSHPKNGRRGEAACAAQEETHTRRDGIASGRRVAQLAIARSAAAGCAGVPYFH